MELVPAIANYFAVTIDELFGYDNERANRAEELAERIYAMNRENNGRDICMDECIRLAREGLAEFPGNEVLMLCLASMLYNAGYVRYGEHHYIDEDGYNVYDTERHRTYAEWSEAIRLYEKLLTVLPEGDMRQTAVRELVQLYLNTGETERGLALVESVPSINDCREYLRLGTCAGAKRAELQGDALLQTVQACADTMIGGVIVNGTHLTPEEGVQTVKNAIAVYDLVCTDGNYGPYHAHIVCLYLYLSYRQWLAGEKDDAFVSLDRALEHGLLYEEVRTRDSFTYTAPLIRLVTHSVSRSAEAGLTAGLPDDWPWWCEPGSGKVRAEMEADPRWNDWAGRCTGDLRKSDS